MEAYVGDQYSAWESGNFDGTFSGYSSWGGSLADWVLDQFNFNPVGFAGGSLEGYDIVHQDAYQMIQLSLAEELKNGDLYECYADEYGNAKYYHIGYETSSSNYLYKLESDVLPTAVNKVVVRGFNPPPVRTIGSEIDPLSMPLVSDDEVVTYEPHRIQILGEQGENEFCEYSHDGYYLYARESSYSNGIADPHNYEQLAGFIYSFQDPGYSPGNTTVSFESAAVVYHELYTFGELVEQKWREQSTAAYTSNKCIGFVSVDGEGVYFPPGADRGFIDVQAVYIYGSYLKHISLDVYFDEAGKRQNGPADFLVETDSLKRELFELTRGVDYVVNSDASGIRIAFASNVSPNYKDLYGGVVEGGVCSFRVSPLSIFADLTFGSYANVSNILSPAVEASGYTKDGEPINNTDVRSGTIFPVNEGDSGYIVDKIIVAYTYDTPAIHITDQRNNVDSSRLSDIIFTASPIIIQDLPAPVAVNGEILDQSATIADTDVSTVQNLSDNEYTRVMNSLQKGDINITLPFLDEDDVVSASETIRSLANASSRENSYIFGPGATLSLGGNIEGNTINSITYSYQDSSQYIITANTGPKWLGSGSWANSVRTKRTETVTCVGTVRQVSEDNSICEVYVPRKMETLTCVNCTKGVIQRDDTVSVTIYNNPVEA